jgi:hypothetical protein
MAHIKAVDGKQRTIIMVQVENEAGTLGADRDHSAAAEALFTAPVPADMPGAKAGSWQDNYAEKAPEAFMAYHTARYIGAVAAAGRKAYDLPMYANVWPREQPGLLRPGDSSPSGGAVSWLLPQWKALAPAIDVVGVDNYDTNVAPYTQIAKAYDIPGNPLFVPETGAASPTPATPSGPWPSRAASAFPNSASTRVSASARGRRSSNPSRSTTNCCAMPHPSCCPCAIRAMPNPP